MNKKLVAVAVAGLGLMGLGVSASAANFANALLNVEVSGTLSMKIIGSDQTSLAAIAPGGSSISDTGIILENDSAGILESFQLQGFDSGSWLLDQTAGNSRYALQALFNTAKPVAGDFSNVTDFLKIDSDPDAVINNGLRTASATVFAGDQTGNGVAPGTQRTVWFKFDAPTITNTFGARQLTVSIVAGLAE